VAQANEKRCKKRICKGAVPPFSNSGAEDRRDRLVFCITIPIFLKVSRAKDRGLILRDLGGMKVLFLSIFPV
jgi:hypothetical protein